MGWGGVGCKNVHVTCVELEATCMLRGCYGHSKVMLCTSQAYAMLDGTWPRTIAACVAEPKAGQQAL